MIRCHAISVVFAGWSLGLACGALPAQIPPALESPLTKLESALPRDAAGLLELEAALVRDAARQLEAACAELSETQIVPGRPPASPCRALLAAKHRSDAQLERMLAMRQEVAGEGADAARRYLQCVSTLIDLSGRLRYVQYDAFDAAAAASLENSDWQQELVGAATNAKSLAAANAWGVALLPAEPGSEAPPTIAARSVLELYAAVGDASLLSSLAEYIRQPSLAPSQRLKAVEAIRRVGLPQDPRPQDGDDAYRPAMLGKELLGLTEATDDSALSAAEQLRRDELLAWLRRRNDHGVTEHAYRLGNVEVQPGDWLLMRNPSPYNHFTNLSPGLFTHVGVITDEIGPDGKRRMVVVDLPERGNRMPATNFDTFVLRTLHYVVLRHPEPAVAARMADAARTLIDAPTEFDLNFDTSRVAELRGRLAPGVKVKTYCAGLLLICAQETSLPREAFFPFSESVAGGRTAQNLAALGLSVKADFISPTGPLFSPSLQLVARREPLYEPGREIREALYDYFAGGLAERTLVSAPDLQQSLRIRLAEMAGENPLLAAALARANQVSEDLDLVSAAKAAAVVEALDKIADDAATGFVNARDAIRAGSVPALRAARVPRAEIQEIETLRRRHASLWRDWEGQRISPRELRLALVAYYIDRGTKQIDERFFGRPDAAD